MYHQESIDNDYEVNFQTKISFLNKDLIYFITSFNMVEINTTNKRVKHQVNKLKLKLPRIVPF
jgi:hypothetical protein